MKSATNLEKTPNKPNYNLWIQSRATNNTVSETNLRTSLPLLATERVHQSQLPLRIPRTQLFTTANNQQSRLGHNVARRN
jgi:hypothetical protein